MDNGIDIRFILRVLHRRRWIMLTTVVLIAAGALTIATVLPPVYQAQARLLVESQQIPTDLVRSTVTSVAEERLQFIKQRITTRDALLALGSKFNLFPEERKQLTPTELVNRMRERITMETVDFSTRSRGRRETLVIGFTVAFEDRSPGTAVRIVNDLVTSILQEDVKTRTERASDTTQFLQRETDRRREELAKLESRISTFKLENDVSLPEKQPYQLGRLDNARAQLLRLGSEMQSNIEQQRLLQLELSVREAGGDVGPTSQSSVSSPKRELQLLKAELATKQTIYRDGHPDIVALKQQISGLQATIVSSTDPDTSNVESAAPSINLPVRLLEAKIAALTERYKKLQVQREDMARSVESINALILRIPEVQGALSNLERRREIAQKGVEELTQKLNDARLGERLERDRQAERFQVIEQPIVPTEPVRPNRPLILAGGLAAALGAAFGITLLLEMLNRSVRTANDIARAISQMPLGVIPYLETDKERRRHKSRIIYTVITLLAFGLASLAAIHWFYLPLDELSFKVLKRFGFL